MKKLLSLLLFLLFITGPVFAVEQVTLMDKYKASRDLRAVKKLINSQVKYANKNDFKKFIATYDDKYVNGDGFNLEIYSSLVKDLWNVYDGIEYGIQFKNISIDKDKAIVELIETSNAQLLMEPTYIGELKSSADSVYYLKKNDGKWKVVSDFVKDETTSMLYGDARNLDIKLDVPTKVESGVDYIASLEFVPPTDTIAIASIASDLVEYPQKPTKEVFRIMPEDNILERIFTSNTDNLNEYIVASIGLTKTAITDLSLKLSLTGFGYTIRRVNVLSKEQIKEQDVKVK